MRRPSLRPALNRLNQWWHDRARRAIRKGRQRVVALVPSLFLPAGWSLITWSMFGWSPRAWAASVGIYLTLSALAPVVATYVEMRRIAASRSTER